MAGSAKLQLTAIGVKNQKTPGFHHDGFGLYLLVKETGSKSWVYRYRVNGRRRLMGLGAVTNDNGLAEARKAATNAKALVDQGIDPIDAKAPVVAAVAGIPTFNDQAKILIEALAPGWRGKKTKAGWERNLLTHAKALSKLPVDKITVTDVVNCVRPFWLNKPESGGKLRERIERVLDSAKADNHIKSPWENPARWKGNLEYKLPKRKKLTRGHFEALHYDEAPAFMEKLAEVKGMGARGLEWTILTTARENMTMGAEWTEIKGKIWTVPAERMKGGKPFEIPLTDDALAVLDKLAVGGRTGYIFKGTRKGTHISNATMDAVLKRMKVRATPHGFRSTFRDWAGDKTKHERDIAEMCLAHVVGDEVERAYRRADALEKRRALLKDWANYLFKRRTSKR